MSSEAAIPPAQDPLESLELTFLLGLAFQLVLGEFVARLDAAGYEELRPIHGLVFQALRSGGATATELAEQIGVTKQGTGQIVDYLEDLGYVERRAHPSGGRRRLVALTAKAEQHLTVAGRTLHEFERELDASLGDPNLTHVRRQLALIIRELAGDKVPALRPVW